MNGVMDNVTSRREIGYIWREQIHWQEGMGAIEISSK